jgi:uncharacterized membrane protein YdjX (TVP38/TMEM64 family)
MQNATKQANLIGLGLTILALVALSFVIDIEELKGWVINAGPWAPVLFILLKITTVVVAPISGSPLYPLIGLLFGFFPGFLYAALGDFLGYTIAFFISRYFGRALVLKLIEKNETGLLARIVDRIGDEKGFFFACLAFGVFPELLAYGAGLSRLSYFKCILILWPLSMIVSATLVLFGSSISLTNGSFLGASLIPMVIGGAVFATGLFLFYRHVKE